jgi:hypothetical protein
MRKLFLLAFSIIFFIAACTKIETTNIGAGLIPPVDNVTTFDTLLAVQTSSQFGDIIPTVYKNDDHVIGNLNDPIFGTTTASAYFELKPTRYPYYLQGVSGSIKADSADLFIAYTGFYGDSSAAAPNQTWQIKEIDQSNFPAWKGDTAYKTDVTIAANNVLKPAETINVSDVINKSKDTIKTRFENLTNVIRIKLPKAVAQRFIEAYDSIGANAPYRSDSLFRRSFAGFAITPSGSQGNTLIRVNLLNPNTKLALYYRSKATATANEDTLVNYFVFDQFASPANANRVIRNHNGTEVATAINAGATDRVYIQTSPGTYANVSIPGLKGMPNAIIHRAELIAEQDQAGDNLFDVLTPPRYLLLSRFDTAFKGKANVPNDYELINNTANIETFGGYLYYKNLPGFTKPVASYSFNLTRYTQGIVTRKDSSYVLRISAPSNDSLKYTEPFPLSRTTPFYLSPSSANYIAHGRVRLGGGTHANAAIRMRLRIIYSKI